MNFDSFRAQLTKESGGTLKQLESLVTATGGFAKHKPDAIETAAPLAAKPRAVANGFRPASQASLQSASGPAAKTERNGDIWFRIRNDEIQKALAEESGIHLSGLHEIHLRTARKLLWAARPGHRGGF
jgi:hypothetical protein